MAAGHGNRTHQAVPLDTPRPVLKTGASTRTAAPATPLLTRTGRADRVAPHPVRQLLDATLGVAIRESTRVDQPLSLGPGRPAQVHLGLQQASQGFGCLVGQAFDHTRGAPGRWRSPVLPELTLFVSTTREGVPAGLQRYASVDGCVPGALLTWDPTRGSTRTSTSPAASCTSGSPPSCSGPTIDPVARCSRGGTERPRVVFHAGRHPRRTVRITC